MCVESNWVSHFERGIKWITSVPVLKCYLPFFLLVSEKMKCKADFGRILIQEVKTNEMRLRILSGILTVLKVHRPSKDVNNNHTKNNPLIIGTKWELLSKWGLIDLKKISNWAPPASSYTVSV